MAILKGFDASTVDPMDDFTPIPSGKYPAVVIESTTKPTKAGTGSYLELVIQITEGEFKGRLLWVRLNLDNPSEEAVRIANGQLASLCRAVGVMKPADSTELHNLPFIVTVKIKNDPGGEPRNEVKGFGPRVTPAAPRLAQAAQSTAPWKR